MTVVYVYKYNNYYDIATNSMNYEFKQNVK